jgi:hypothetical protein
MLIAFQKSPEADKCGEQCSQVFFFFSTTTSIVIIACLVCF